MQEFMAGFFSWTSIFWVLLFAAGVLISCAAYYYKKWILHDPLIAFHFVVALAAGITMSIESLFGVPSIDLHSHGWISYLDLHCLMLNVIAVIVHLYLLYCKSSS